MNYEEYNSLIVDQLDPISYIIDIDAYEIIYLTRAGMKKYGLSSPEEYIGKKCYKVLQGREDPCPFCTNHLLKENQEYRWEHYNESIKTWFELRDIKIRIENKPYRLEIAQDITTIKNKQKELEAALEKANHSNKSKTNFLFNMSHDIRTPMNAILGFSMMAEKYIDDKERVLDSLAKLNGAGKHLQRLINDVLDLSRVESGKMTFDLKPHHIPSLLQDTQKIFDIEMQKKNIEFSVIVDIQNEMAFLDQLRMEQVEMNLISNAMKYTPEGGKVSYTISQIGKSEDGYATYQGIVKDNGIGMSEEFCARVFDPYEREKTSTVEGIQGTGLGLAITKSLIDQMGGTILCKSKPGEGTEFIFTIKFKVSENESLPEKIETCLINSNFTGKRILLVEDNELNREIAHDILEEYGFLVETAEDGAIAVDTIKHSLPGYFDLILMDIQTPNMDGYQATREIRNLKDSTLANIPIIAMTANAFEEDRQNALAAGMNEHLSKPLDIPKMIATLHKIL